MAENIKFESQKAKTEAYDADIATAEENGLEATAKGVINVPATADETLSGSTIDVSGSGFFKTVSVAGGFDGNIAVTGSSTVANTFYAGGKGSTLFGDGGEASSKPVADKLYGGGGNDTFVYAVSGGKDAIYNYSSGNDSTTETAVGGDDVIVLQGYDASKHSLGIVDKSGGITVTISDSSDANVAKNSVLTVDGKTASAADGFKFVDSIGNEILTYGAWDKDVYYYADKKGKDDTATVTINGAAEYEGTIDLNKLSSTAKSVYVIDSEDGDAQAFHIIGNVANANSITIGAGGGTLDGGSGGTKATADKLLGTSKGEVVFVYDAVMGGKDVIGDSKLTTYNYKAGDKIVITSGTVDTSEGATANTETHTATIANSSGNVVITFDKNNVLTINGGVGKPINIYTVDSEGNISETPYIEAWGDLLQTGLTYDAKLSKISADAAVIASSGSESILVYDSTVIGDDGSVDIKAHIEWRAPEIYVGGGDYETYAASVKEIDLSAATIAAVNVNTAGDEHSGVTVVKVGGAGSEVVANDSVAQTFTAGAGEDTFVISAKKLEINNFKGDTINSLGAGDTIQITDLDVDDVVTVSEKSKDLIVAINGTTFLTLKNAVDVFTKDSQLSIVDEDGETINLYPTNILGVDYGTTTKGTDKTTLLLTETVGADVVSAADFGDATIKKIDATAVTSVAGGAGIEIIGGSGANTMLAPTATTIATTLNGAAGNDALTSGAGQTTFVFQSQAKGKKDTINNYKSGDIIVIDQSLVEASDTLVADISESGGHGSLQYVSAYKNDTATYSDGFNDSKSAVVITLNKGNTITVNDGAGKAITIQDANGDQYVFGHVLPSDAVAYDSKLTTISLVSGSTFDVEGTTDVFGYEYDENKIDLSDYGTYYSTVKKVDLSGNTVATNIYGNTLANEFVAGDAGGILDGGSVYGLEDAKGNALKPTADKITGGGGADTFVYDAGYGKDSFLNFGEGDVVSLGAGITKDNISITDKGSVLTVSLIDLDWDTVKGAVKTAANSSFTVTKASGVSAVTFVGEDLPLADDDDELGSFVYGALPEGVSMDAKYATLSVDSTASAGVYVDLSAINSQPKVIDGKAATGGAVLIGNANADNIYGGGTADGAGSTLFGGTAGTKAAKDALYGSDGKDYFLFTSQGGEKGKETDSVYNYQAGDVIVLDTAPDSIKADGKTITLTWNDTPEGGKATASTLVINGAAQTAEMKKFNSIDSSVSVTFAVGYNFIDSNGAVDLSDVAGFESTYTFNIDTAEKDKESAAYIATAALKKGTDWDTAISEYIVTPSEDGDADTDTDSTAENEQYAASAWFEEAVSTDNVIGSELDSILDSKGSTTELNDQFNGDAYFTGIGQQADNSLLTSYAARHRAKK